MSETSHSRTGGNGGGRHWVAAIALLTSSETIRHASWHRPANPHSRSTRSVWPRAQGTALGSGPSASQVRSGHRPAA
ncbi:MAG TPA: hypothetical protein DHU96_20090 [Actinobacteria bacterium]|nr:hypothetical protein [Actinomycetota bacterium]